jgi:hypothetical protein
VVIGELLPLALVVTISPINIIAAILLLFTKRPLVTASSYLAGFIAGVAVMLTAFVAIAGAVDLSAGSGHATWGAALKSALGGCLLVAGVYKFRGRPRTDGDASLPKWMDGVVGYGVGRSLGTGVVVGALNPKNIAVGLAAAITVASAGLSTAEQIGTIAVYVFIAVLGVAAPILVMLSLGDKAQEVLGGWRSWLERNNSTVMSVLYLVFGVVLIGQGIAGM